jgi:predicted TIM-barrel fold metal-dependent hydrolase
MDDHMEAWGHATAKLPLRPSEYFRRQCFVSCDPQERTLPAVVELVGDGCVVFASDYPHPDAISGDLVGRISGRDGLGSGAKEKILARNAERCFGLAPAG